MKQKLVFPVAHTCKSLQCQLQTGSCSEPDSHGLLTVLCVLAVLDLRRVLERKKLSTGGQIASAAVASLSPCKMHVRPI
jgi:hypothetical protein